MAWPFFRVSTPANIRAMRLVSGANDATCLRRKSRMWLYMYALVGERTNWHEHGNNLVDGDLPLPALDEEREVEHVLDGLSRSTAVGQHRRGKHADVGGGRKIGSGGVWQAIGRVKLSAGSLRYTCMYVRPLTTRVFETEQPRRSRGLLFSQPLLVQHNKTRHFFRTTNINTEEGARLRRDDRKRY